MRGWALGVVAMVLLVGCSSGGSKAAAPPPTSTTPTTAVACPAGSPAPTGLTDSTTAPGDFDGDGKPDKLTTYRVASAGAWHVRVDLASGGASEVELPATATGVKAVGASALDVGTGDAAFVVVNVNNGTPSLGLFVLSSCKLARATLAGSALAEFPVQTGAMVRAGVACQVPGLVVYSATSTDGQTFAASSVSYLLVGTLLDEAHRTMTPLAANDPTLATFGAFTCGSLKL